MIKHILVNLSEAPLTEKEKLSHYKNAALDKQNTESYERLEKKKKTVAFLSTQIKKSKKIKIKFL